MKFKRPAVLMVECADEWDPTELAVTMAQTRTTWAHDLSADDFGDPYNRKRCVSVSLEDSKVGLLIALVV